MPEEDSPKTAAQSHAIRKAPLGAHKIATVKRGNSAEVVYRELRRDIISMSMAPGSFIDETTLSKRFGLSRSPIREALVRLSAEGLVISEQNRCPIVAPLNLLHLPKLMDALCLMQRMNSRLAAQYRTQEDLDILMGIHERHIRAVADSDIMLMVDLNRKLHAAVGKAGKNPYLSGPYSKILDETCRLIRLHALIYDDKLPVASVQEHVDLLQAIHDRDADRADELARQHALELANSFVRFISANSFADVDIALPGHSKN